MTLRRMKVWWLKARIAYHMRQADSYNQAIARSFRRDHYGVWTRNMALRHAVKAHDLKTQTGRRPELTASARAECSVG